MYTHSQAQGSDAVVPLYLPSTHWQLADPVTLRQGAHGSLLYPSLNVPLGHSVQYNINVNDADI